MEVVVDVATATGGYRTLVRLVEDEPTGSTIQSGLLLGGQDGCEAPTGGVVGRVRREPRVFTAVVIDSK